MDDDRKLSLRGWSVGAAIVVLVLALYVLSIGPAFRATYLRKTISEDALGAIYAPVFQVSMRCPPIERCLMAYLRWWLPTEQRPCQYRP